MSDEGFAPPAFRPAEALVLLKRQLRDMKPLAERGSRYEIKGRPALELTAGDTTLQARLARRLATIPDWQPMTLSNSLEVRRFVDTVQKRLRDWERED
jgi:hypothetical protein